ncbi:hypothetical protein [Streptomyces sp. YPW6]|uniref:hypothetical protein n=1 Tax=Streptomyces sp. YPW6 TaxID=2840373 RepID=UPI003EC08D34
MAAVACTLLVAGCSVSVDPGELPGAYRDEETGGEIVLNSDGTFFATGISPDDATGGGGADARDFSGRWEFVDKRCEHRPRLPVGRGRRVRRGRSHPALPE